MKRIIIVFSVIIILIFALFRLSKFAFISKSAPSEIIIISLSVFFLVLGIYISKSFNKSTEHIPATVNSEKIKELDLSEREYEVLLKIASGLSNKEIAEQLYLSESTIKTHVSNLFVKLNVSRRTQAVKTAKELQII